MVPWKIEHITPFVRLPRGRGSLVVHGWEILSILPLSGCRAFVLDGTKRLQDCRSSRLYRLPRVPTRVSITEQRRTNHKIANRMGADNGAKVDYDLVAKVLQKPSEERGHFSR